MRELNQYKNKYSKKFFRKIELSDFVNRIKTNSINIPKQYRVGTVFATVSDSGRKLADITRYTGLMFLDLDNCTDSPKVKDILIKSKTMVSVWYSSSGNIHALVKIPICKSKSEYKRRYAVYIKMLEPFIKDYVEIDKSASNPVQIAFESSDKDIYYNPKAEVFKDIEPEVINTIVAPIYNVIADNKDEEFFNQEVNRWFSEIVSNGNPQVFAKAGYSGSRAAGMGIDSDKAFAMVESAIRENQYLNSKQSSGSISKYIKVAKKSFNYGLQRPKGSTSTFDKKPVSVNKENIVISNDYGDETDFYSVLENYRK